MKLPKGWKMAALEEVAEIQTGLSKSENRAGPFVRMPYLRVANVQDGHFDLSEVKEIDVPEGMVERFRVRQNDVLLTEGGDFDKLGRGAVWEGQIKNCVHQNHIFVVRPHMQELNMRFFAYQTQSPHGRAYFQSCSKQSTNLASVNSTQLRQFPTLLPPLPEQRKIAEILGAWDDGMEKLDALIAVKERRKKGLMQRLLTGKRRVKGFKNKSGDDQHDRFGVYPGDWKNVSLGKITTEVISRNVGGQELPVLSCTKHEGLVLSEEYFGRRVYAEDTSAYRVVPRNHFAYATNHIEEGSVGYQTVCDIGLVSPIYTVFQSKPGVDDRYLFRVLKSPLLVHLYRANTSASVNRRGGLRYDEFAKISVWLPPLAEQRAIADILDACDEELRLLRARRAAVEKQKRGLMQRLLTGKARINIEG